MSARVGVRLHHEHIAIARARSCHRQLHPVSAADSQLHQLMTVMKKMLLRMNQQDLSDCVGHQVNIGGRRNAWCARLTICQHFIN